MSYTCADCRHCVREAGGLFECGHPEMESSEEDMKLMDGGFATWCEEFSPKPEGGDQ